MVYDKQPLDYPQQIQLLKDRGMIISDDEFARKQLEFVSYFRLANYWRPMEADKIRLKKEMARSLGIPQHIYMESWIRAITILRNCIAHHARTWNRKFPFNPQMPEKLNGKWISKIDSSNQNLYPLLCVLAYLENVIHTDNKFVTLFKQLLDEYPNVDVAAMGFPKNWENEPLWR